MDILKFIDDTKLLTYMLQYNYCKIIGITDKYLIEIYSTTLNIPMITDVYKVTRLVINSTGHYTLNNYILPNYYCKPTDYIFDEVITNNINNNNITYSTPYDSRIHMSLNDIRSMNYHNIVHNCNSVYFIKNDIIDIFNESKIYDGLTNYTDNHKESLYKICLI
jgi:hypothetical protein